MWWRISLRAIARMAIYGALWTAIEFIYNDQLKYVVGIEPVDIGFMFYIISFGVFLLAVSEYGEK